MDVVCGVEREEGKWVKGFGLGEPERKEITWKTCL